MPRKRSDMTLTQKDAADNDKFRAELYKQHREEAQAAPVNDDIAKFRRDAYKEALGITKAGIVPMLIAQIGMFLAVALLMAANPNGTRR